MLYVHIAPVMNEALPLLAFVSSARGPYNSFFLSFFLSSCSSGFGSCFCNYQKANDGDIYSCINLRLPFVINKCNNTLLTLIKLFIVIDFGSGTC